MMINKNLSDNFFCDYFKWLSIKEKEKGKRNPDIISHTCVCVCVCVCVCSNFCNGNSANFAFP